MRREYEIEDGGRNYPLEQAIANITRVFRRHGLAVGVSGNKLVLTADTVLMAVHQQEMAARAIQDSGFKLKPTGSGEL
jgi:hypothetical protein